MSAAKTLLVVDFSAVFWRQWHATAEDALSYAVSRTVEQIREVAREHDHTVIAFDSPDCWRRDIWPEYKANRPPKDELALEQMRAAQAKVAEEWPTMAAPRCEADDVIAAIVGALPDEWEATILSADKDLLQLLDRGVSMFHLGRGVGIEVDDIRAELGVSVGLVPDWLALVGDKSDNVLGVDGVGPKRAADLLTKYGSIHGIFKALADDPEQFTPKGREALATAARRADCPVLTALELVTLDLEGKRCGLENIMETITNWKPKEIAEMTIETIEPVAGIVSQADKALNKPAHLAALAIQRLTSPEIEATVNAATECTKPTTAIVAPEWKRALEPTDSRTAYGLAKVVVSSRMFSGYGTPEQALLVLMAGRDFGMSAMASLRSFHIVEGKPTLSAQAMMGRCLEHPSCKLFRVVQSQCTAERAVVQVQRHGWPEPETYSWTIEDAKRAGLAGRQNWSKYPREMLINRCIAEAARFTWPEVMAGVYAPEEFGGIA